MHHFLRLFHTLRYLRLRQLFYQVFYRLSGRLQGSKVVKNEQRSPPQHQETGRPYRKHSPKDQKTVQETLAKRPKDLTRNTSLKTKRPKDQSPNPQDYRNASFTFLSIKEDFKTIPSINWNFHQHGKLWTYNLNYFEFLRHPEISVAAAQNLIDDWIKKSPTHLDGWEPYPLSLRIVHWVRFYAERELVMPDHVTESLYQQYRNLQRKIEYHLMGNHLLENAIALTLAAEFFGDRKYLQKASGLLADQLKEQYLPTGAHLKEVRCTTAFCSGVCWIYTLRGKASPRPSPTEREK